ncbi:hypothetical protein F1735_34805, partial [Massilia sp. CCM 8694]|nr:hypothetical protein [Massilia genomosp. 1]
FTRLTARLPASIAISLGFVCHQGCILQIAIGSRNNAAERPLTSYPTLRRYLLAHGMHRQARLARTSAGALAARDRLEQLEVRS